MSTNGNYAFSGHETFAFRFAWLPKAVQAILADPTVFSNENAAMVTLGVGKNMVRSIRFWSIATGVLAPADGQGYTLTPFGSHVFHPETGLDPYLEDDQTLWLLHWQLACATRPLFAWEFLLNTWHEPDLIPSAITMAAKRCLHESGIKVSDSSLRGHLAVFFHTYYPTRSKKKADVAEARLDCPLVQLDFLEYRGDRESLHGKTESVYAFRRGRKPEIHDRLFCYALCDFWRTVAPSETTLSFREIATRTRSPGQIFKLEDLEIRERLERLTDVSKGFLSYSESSLVQDVHRTDQITADTLRELREGIYT